MTIKDLTSIQSEQLRCFILALTKVGANIGIGGGFKLWALVEAWYRKYDIMRANLFDYTLFCELPTHRRSAIYQEMGYGKGEPRMPRCICAGCVIASFEHGDPEFADNLKWFQLAHCIGDERMWLVDGRLHHREGSRTSVYWTGRDDLYPEPKIDFPKVISQFEKIMAERNAHGGQVSTNLRDLLKPISPPEAIIPKVEFSLAAGPFTTQQLVDAGIEVHEKATKTIVADSFKMVDSAGETVLHVEKPLTYAPSDTLLAAKGFLSEREEVGYHKYGQTLDRNDLGFGDLVHHAKEEAGDLLMYLTAAQDRIQKAKDMVQAALDGHVILDLNDLKEMLK